MKNIVEFLKTSTVGGVLVLLPLLLLYMLLAELLELVVALATPIADLFPQGTFDKINAPVLLALIRSMLGRLPLYNAVKSLSRGLVGANEEGVFRPAVLNSPDGSREIVYVIEDHGDGQVTILIPWAP
ncbi:MAG: hypothetical protein JRJ60_22805, partial [Deltaproteobacteria bacterium]|nr:hypothetical protein [Deltaproteobacteria bacterium]